MPTSQPNYLVINPDGSTGAQFAGGVAIVGDTDPAYTYSAPRAQKSVSWHRDTVTGALIAAVSVGDLNAGTRTELDATAQTADGVSRASLIATADSVAAQHATLTALATGSGAPGEVRRLIIDDSSKSDYLQLAVRPGGNIQVAFGFTNLVWGGSNISGTVTVSHGISAPGGLIPKVIAGMGGADTGALMFAQVDPITATSFGLRGTCTNSSTLSGTFRAYWIAIG